MGVSNLTCSFSGKRIEDGEEIYVVFLAHKPFRGLYFDGCSYAVPMSMPMRGIYSEELWRPKDLREDFAYRSFLDTFNSLIESNSITDSFKVESVEDIFKIMEEKDIKFDGEYISFAVYSKKVIDIAWDSVETYGDPMLNLGELTTEYLDKVVVEYLERDKRLYAWGGGKLTNSPINLMGNTQYFNTNCFELIHKYLEKYLHRTFTDTKTSIIRTLKFTILLAVFRKSWIAEGHCKQSDNTRNLLHFYRGMVELLEDKLRSEG